MKMDLDKLNSATKYPSIPTYHPLNQRGVVHGEPLGGFDSSDDIIITEKVDGTNARIVVFPDGDWLIGSRENWLHAKGDRVWVKDNGIVDVVRPVIERITTGTEPFVVYGEVYGGKINGAKNYTSTGQTGFRVFDVAPVNMVAVDDMELPAIAMWRDNVGPEWIDFGYLQAKCAHWNIPCVPRFECRELPPMGIDATLAWMNRIITKTHVQLDCEGHAEGLVIRSNNNKHRAKLRFDDYQKAQRKQVVRA